MYRGLIFIAALSLAGCATLTKEECLEGNWHAIGVNDGLDGEPPKHLDEHRRACRPYDIEVDAALWEAGRREGLKSYCTARIGYRVGVDDKTYHGVCPPERAPRFHAGREIGLEVNRLARRLASARHEIESITWRISQTDSDIDDIERRLHETSDWAAKQSLIDEKSELQRRLRQLESDRYDAERDLIREEAYVEEGLKNAQRRLDALLGQ